VKRDRKRPIAIELHPTAYPDRAGFHWVFVLTKTSGYCMQLAPAAGWRRDLLSMREALPEAVKAFREMKPRRFFE
jgi:hypothetical protein